MKKRQSKKRGGIMDYKITLKLVRSFGLGFTIYSPKSNGLYVSIDVGCFVVDIWSRGKKLFGFENYWN